MSVQKQEKEQEEKANGVVNCSTPDTSDSECCSDQDQDTAVPADAAPPRVPQSDYRDDDDHHHHNHKDEEDDEDDIPEEFICPLTLELFNVPLMDRRGMNFERKAIVEWLNRGHRTCPLTREPLTYRSFIPDVNLKARVDHWKRMHGYRVRPYSSNYCDAEEEEGEQKYFMIQAPPRSSMELRWEHAYQRAVREEILQNVLNRNSNNDNGNGPADGSARRRRRHRRRRNHHSQHSSNNNTAATETIASPTGVSPATQRRRLAGMIGEALNIVRRPPLATSEH